MPSTPTPPPPKPDGEKEEEDQNPDIVLTDVVKDEEAAAAGNHNEEDVHTQADSEDSGSRVPVMSKPVAPERTWMVRLISIAVLLVIAIVAVGVMGALGVFDSNNSNTKSADPVLSESENFQSGGDVDVPGPAPPVEDPTTDGGDEPGTGQFEDWFDNDFDVNEQQREPTLPPTWIEDFEPWPDQDGGEYFYRSWYFEDGSIEPWRALGDRTTVSLVSEGIIEGSRSLLVEGRSEVSHGAGYELIGLFSDDTDREKDAIYYSFSGCMTFLSGGQGQCYYVLTIAYGDGTEARIEYDPQSVTPGSVTEFWGEYTISDSEAEWTSAIVSVECEDPDVPFILDAMSVSLTIAPE